MIHNQNFFFAASKVVLLNNSEATVAGSSDGKEWPPDKTEINEALKNQPQGDLGTVSDDDRKEAAVELEDLKDKAVNAVEEANAHNEGAIAVTASTEDDEYIEGDED